MTTARSGHTATLLHDGRVLLIGGDSGTAELYDPSTGVFTATGSLSESVGDLTATVLKDGRVLVTYSFNGGRAELYDPSTGVFTMTGNMRADHGGSRHTSTLLRDGRVLIAGGGSAAELYDPATGTFTQIGNLITGRSSATATLLNNGRVLIAGGDGAGTAELYDPATQTFTATGSMTAPRSFHTATLLTNGKVLLVGNSSALATTDIYDPATGTFTAGPALETARSGQTATLLTDGSVLVAGGSSSVTAEIFWPDSLTPAGLTSISVAVDPQNASVLAGSSQVYVATGTLADGSQQRLQSVIWSTADSAVATIGNDATDHGVASALKNGTVAITACAGTVCGSGSLQVGAAATALMSLEVAPTEMWMPLTRTLTLTVTGLYGDGSKQDVTLQAAWSTSDATVATVAGGVVTPVGAGDVSITASLGGASRTATVHVVNGFTSGWWGMTPPRTYAAATLLNDGRVLLAGGYGFNRTAELFTMETGPGQDPFSATGSMTSYRHHQAAMLLHDGRVLMVTGSDSGNTAEIYDPSTGVFTATGSPLETMGDPRAVVLKDGRVLSTYGSHAELYDPSTGVFTMTGNMHADHGGGSGHTSMLLHDGRVVVMGGGSAAELYDPATGTFTQIGDMRTGRVGATATLLNNGRVLIAGGDGAGTAELYDPSMGVFTATGNLLTPRSYHTATLLTNGKVLIVGGSSALATTEIYDPSTGVFTAGSSLTWARSGQTATLLTDGSVLVAGGSSSVTAEIFWPDNLTPAGLTSISVAADANIDNGSSVITQPYVATGIISDGSAQTLQSVIWTTSDSTVAKITNDATDHGIAQVLKTGAVTISACAGSICGSTAMATALDIVKPTSTLLHDTVRIEWIAAGPGSDTASVDIQVSGNLSLTVGSHLAVSSTTDWDTTSVPDGQYSLRLVLHDANGNVLKEATKAVLINNSVYWHSGTVQSNQTWAADRVHVIDADLVIPSGVTVTIAPGAIIKVAKGAQITVQSGGALNALGANGQRITFTSLDDDSVGGDTNTDGNTTSPVPGEWGGVTVQSGGQFNANDYVDEKYLQATQSGALGANQSWLGSQLYQVTDNVTVPNGVILTIQAGAIVKFNPGKSITVQTGGKLLASGTVAQPIYFTSVADDSVGGDTNGDGSLTAPAPGDWVGVIVDGGSATLDHTQITYGGGDDGSGMGGLVESKNSGTVTVSNSILGQTMYEGVLAYGGVANITSTVITGAQRGVNVWTGATTQIVNSTIDGNVIGVLPHGGSVGITNTIISNSQTHGIWSCCGNPATVSHSDVWTTVPGADNYSSMSDETGSNGNISVDPIYQNRPQGNFRLNFGSPAIDAADGTIAPVTDLMGTARYSDPRTANKTGIPGANSAFPDMGAYEFVESAESDVDLIVASVSGPPSAQSGSNAQITWTIKNSGTGAAVGPWHDDVYLVRDPDTNPVALLAGEVLVGKGVTIGPGNSYTATAEVRVPGSTIGNHRWQVKTNVKGEIFEGQNTANNTGTSLGTISLDLPELTLNGGTMSGAFTSAGQSWWYKVRPGADVGFNVNLALTNQSGTVQLYIASGYLPDSQNHDAQQQEWNSPTANASVSNTSSQTYYVTAYAQTLTNSQSPFTISAATQKFSLTSVSPSSIVNGQTATVEFIGSQLRSDALYQLVAANGSAYPATSAYVSDASHVYATFATSGMSAGTYSAQVVQDGVTTSLSGAVTVTAATGGTGNGNGYVSPIEYNLDVPTAVRGGYGGTVTVHYRNISSQDAAAPLMILSTDGASSSFIAPQCTGCSNYFPSLYQGMAGQGQFLGINPTGPAGILPPGAEGSISLNFTASTNGSSVNFSLYTVDSPDQTIDWSSVKDSMRPSYISAEAWDPIFANFNAAIGSTWGTYNQALADDATYLSKLGKSEYRVSQLQMFELTKAGMDTIAQRYKIGAYGRGGNQPFDIWAESSSGGWLIHYPSGSVRPFVNDASNPSLSVGGIGDNGKLTFNSNDQSILLTEQSGTAYHFNQATGGSAIKALDYIQDLNGNRVTLGYQNGVVTTATDSTGDVVTYTHNDQGRITQVADPVGRTTTYAYDSTGEHLMSVTDPLGTTSFTYVTGQGAAREHAVASVTYPDNTHTYYEYDDHGRVIHVYKDDNAQSVTYAYSASGSVTVTDGKGNISYLYPDENGSVALSIDPLGKVAQASYDPEGKMSGLTGPDGASASILYDTNGNPASVRDPLGNSLSTRYDANGSLLSLTDMLGSESKFGYNSSFNLTSITYPDDRAEQAQYDSRGNLTKWTNRRGGSITYSPMTTRTC
ncbi:MAG: CARDB domain-containing protein [Terracidiphilus sp.]|nr:CARDB domain-containing protein [Terracidiphilus sp.]